jgi:Domain of unknown function (DUF4349)
LSAPEQDRDLARIEAALAAGRPTATDPRERELEELALALRDDSPRPDPEFARRLDDRMAAGFPKPRRLPRLALPGRGWMPALAGATAVLLVALAAVGLLSTGGEDADRQGASGLAEERQSEPPAADPSVTPGVGGTVDRRVERSAEITLAAAVDEIQEVAAGIAQAAERRGGFVLSSDVSTGDDSRRGGSFTLRVPTRELQATLADIGELGDVRSRNESSQDMTVPYRSAEERLGNLLVERRATQEELRAAKDGSDEESALRARLRTLSAEISEASDDMQDVRRRTEFSTVSVTLEAEENGSASTGPGGPADALGDALGMLEGALVLAIRLLGVLLPLALVAALGWLAARVVRRRRREAALF